MIELTRCKVVRQAPLARCPGVSTMLESEKMRLLAERVRYELVWRNIDRGYSLITGDRAIILDYNLDLLGGDDAADNLEGTRRRD